jgi:hypothetical protein
MARELTAKNEIINENWMCTVSANVDGSLYKKQVDLFHPFASISLKCSSSTIAIGYFLWSYSIVDEK